MKLVTQLLHQIADPSLPHDERARLRCQLAQQLEEAGNYEAAREAMGELWRGVSHRPVLDNLDRATAAEVLLRAGVLTGWLGCVKQVEGAQETAKNLISESIIIFEALGDAEKMAEAQMELGYCYWRAGAFDEARVLLKEALTRLTDKAGDLKAVTLSRLATVEKVTLRLSDALHILREAAPLFEISSNHSIKGRFHNEYGAVLMLLGEVENRSDYIDRALIEYAAASFHFEQAGHTRYQAYVENNLGFLFGSIRNFAAAHEHLDRAQALFTSLKDRAHLAQVDDTRARVFLAEGRPAQAEKFARSAVRTLKGDDQQALFAEALTTQGVALARLGRHQHARLTLQSAVEVAQNAGDVEGAGQAALSIIEELGESLTAEELSITYGRATELLAASRNVGTLTRLSMCARRVLFLAGVSPAPASWEGFSLKAATRRYEARIIERALKDAGGVVTRAGRLLGYRNHAALINRLNKWHRHLLGERTPALRRKRSLMFVRDAGAKARPLTILHAGGGAVGGGAVKATLEGEGWAVESCPEGAAALGRLEGGDHFDLLLLDDESPGLSAVELIRRARALGHRRRTPIIMLSGGDVEAAARRAGANLVMRKPQEVAALSEAVARLLARQTGRR